MSLRCFRFVPLKCVGVLNVSGLVVAQCADNAIVAHEAKCLGKYSSLIKFFVERGIYHLLLPVCGDLVLRVFRAMEEKFIRVLSLEVDRFLSFCKLIAVEVVEGLFFFFALFVCV